MLRSNEQSGGCYATIILERTSALRYEPEKQPEAARREMQWRVFSLLLSFLRKKRKSEPLANSKLWSAINRLTDYCQLSLQKEIYRYHFYNHVCK